MGFFRSQSEKCPVCHKMMIFYTDEERYDCDNRDCGKPPPEARTQPYFSDYSGPACGRDN